MKSSLLPQLFRQECEYIWRVSGTDIPKTNPKLSVPIKKIEVFSKELNKSTPFMIAEYAYFYCFVLHMTSYQFVALKVQDFFESTPFAEMPNVSDTDYDTARTLRKVWNRLDRLTMADFSFRIRPLLNKRGVNIGKDTFFKKSLNIGLFAKIAEWINRHRLIYPEIDGYVEFFAALPCVAGGERTFELRNYLFIDKVMDMFYRQVYDPSTPPETRYVRFLALAKQVGSAAYKGTDLFCKEQLLKDLKL